MNVEPQDFTVKGHQMGGTPHFWMARLDIGRADIDIPKSWNAFIDYKYFAHGSFLGVMVQVLYRIVTSMVFAALHSVLAMCLARIYFLRHSTHSMRRALINEIRYMVVKALS